MFQQHSGDFSSNLFGPGGNKSPTSSFQNNNNNSSTTTTVASGSSSLLPPVIGAGRRPSGDALIANSNPSTNNTRDAARMQSLLSVYGGQQFASTTLTPSPSSVDPPSMFSITTSSTTTTAATSLNHHHTHLSASNNLNTVVGGFSTLSPVQQNAPGAFPLSSKMHRAGSGSALTTTSSGIPSPATSTTSLLHHHHHHQHHLIHHHQQLQTAPGWFPSSSVVAAGGSGMGSRYSSDSFVEMSAYPQQHQHQHQHHHHYQYNHQHHYGHAGLPPQGPSSLQHTASGNNNNTTGVYSSLHHHHHHHHSHHLHHHHHHHAFRHRDNSAAVENEDVSGVVVVTPEDLNNLRVESLGHCTVTDIRTANFIENDTYHSENQKETIVTANAYLDNTQTVHQIQRIMVGQLWVEFAKDIHAIGRLLAFIANEPVTIFGLVPNPNQNNGTGVDNSNNNSKPGILGGGGAMQQQQSQGGNRNQTVPTMVGFWLSIDKRDHPDGLLDLQRASILFSKKGILAAFTPSEHRRLLEIADRRRSQGNTGLPESPMTLEAAKNPPKRQTAGSKDMEVFKYYPPKDHSWPQTRGGFQPFVTRWEMSLKEDEGRFAPEKSFALFGTEMGKLKPWGKRVVSRLKMGKINPEDDDIVPVRLMSDDDNE